MHSVPRPRRSASGLIGPMRTRLVRAAIGAALLLSASMALAPAGASAFGLEPEGFFAGNCKAGHSNCAEGVEKVEPPKTELEAKEAGYTQAGGFVPFGVTDFRIKTVEISGVKYPEGIAEGGSIKNIRTDVAPGVVTNPQAIPQCSVASFTGLEVEPTHHLFTEPTCGEHTIIGENKVFSLVEPSPGTFANAHLVGTVYNLTPTAGLAALYGVAVNTGIEYAPGHFLQSHSLIEGSVDWSTDYHDYFVIHVGSPGLIQSRLIFFGNKIHGEAEGTAPFIRNATSCTPPGNARTTTLRLEDEAGAKVEAPYESLIGTEGCEALKFEPGFKLTPETTVTDAADGITTETTTKHPATAEEPDSADLKNAKIVLPPGMTMNPSAAAGLEGCTPAQMGAGVHNGTPFEIASLYPVSCPSGSKIGTFSLEVPTLAPGSLNGSVFLGKPASGSITNPPYTIYLVASSAPNGILVRFEGTITPSASGQLTTTFSNTPGAPFNNPEAPFNSLTLHFNGGNFAPIANPISCEISALATEFLPFSRAVPALGSSPFSTTGCASPQFTAPPLAQSLVVTPGTGGSTSNFSFTIARPQGEQYLSQMKTVLPPGLVAKIPSVPRCAEALANAGNCPSTSQIGTVQVQAGSGTPFNFNGKVFLTEKYEGGAYGLDIVTPTEAGPFNFGPINTRAKISVNEHTAQVEVTVVKSFVQGAAVSGLPTIVGGIPTRIRSITVSITHPNYIINPTNCAALRGESFLSSTLGLNAIVPSGFQVGECSSLPFSPKFTASTAGNKASRANGASLGVNITQVSGQANIGSVVTVLPKQLPSRLTTLQKACLLATFETNPASCPKESDVGTVSAVTPTLPDKMTGKAYIVSRGAAFPDLELVLEGDGVRVILDGKTNIKNSITTTTFGSNPDVPISSFALNLPTGKYSLLAANGSLCKPKLVMPTTLTGQNGKSHKQKTQIKASGCLPILRHQVRGHKVIITVKVPQRGRVRFSGEHMGIVTRFPRRSKKVTITLPLTSPGGLHALRRHHNRLKVRLRVGFIPKARNGAAFLSYATVTFR